MNEYVKSENPIDPLSQLLIKLDSKNLRYRAERGDPEAQCHLGVIFQSEGDTEQATTWYRRAAENGVAQAQFNLGVLLMDGVGLAQNLVEAVRWYEAAAKQGYLNAIYNLAFMHENGYGCAKDFKLALQLYERAANQGEADSLCKLALLLLDEQMQAQVRVQYRHEGWDFLPIDPEKSKRLLKQAANNGHAVSIEILGGFGWK